MSHNKTVKPYKSDNEQEMYDNGNNSSNSEEVDEDYEYITNSEVGVIAELFKKLSESIITFIISILLSQLSIHLYTKITKIVIVGTDYFKLFIFITIGFFIVMTPIVINITSKLATIYNKKK